jgi:hypothetical protein
MTRFLNCYRRGERRPKGFCLLTITKDHTAAWGALMSILNSTDIPICKAQSAQFDMNFFVAGSLLARGRRFTKAQF